MQNILTNSDDGFLIDSVPHLAARATPLDSLWSNPLDFDLYQESELPPHLTLDMSMVQQQQQQHSYTHPGHSISPLSANSPMQSTGTSPGDTSSFYTVSNQHHDSVDAFSLSSYPPVAAANVAAPIQSTAASTEGTAPLPSPSGTKARSSQGSQTSQGVKKKRKRQPMNEAQKGKHNEVEKRYRIRLNAEYVRLHNLTCTAPIEDGKAPNKYDVLEKACERITKLTQEVATLQSLLATTSRPVDAQHPQHGSFSDYNGSF